MVNPQDPECNPRPYTREDARADIAAYCEMQAIVSDGSPAIVKVGVLLATHGLDSGKATRLAKAIDALYRPAREMGLTPEAVLAPTVDRRMVAPGIAELQFQEVPRG